MNTKLILGISVSAALAAALLTGCSKAGAAAGQQAPPKPTVTVATVEEKPIVEWNEFTGHAAAIESVDVRPRVSGYISEVRFKSGQDVKKGDVLFVIDPRWIKSDYIRLQAQAEQAQALLDNAKLEADRTEKLLTNHAISAEESDARIARYKEAKAALDSANASRDYAKLDLDYTEVRAPIDGRVSRAILTVGNYVTGGSGEGSLLTTIVSVDPVYVYADVDEDSLLKFNSLLAAHEIQTDADGRTPVEMQLADETNFTHTGFVESFDNHLDANMGSILLRAVFPNPDGRIVPGLFTRIRLPASAKHNALLLTERAIGTDQSQKYVLTLTSSNTVAYQSVELGPEIDGKRVIRSGIHAGDKVVVNGLSRVRPGMPVDAQEEGAPGAAPVAAR